MLTAVVVLGVAVADSAVVSAERSALDRQAAVALSDRLVAADSALTTRSNVLDSATLENLTESKLRTQYGLASDSDVAVSLDGNGLISTGSVDDGVTVDRLVVVRERHERTLTPSFPAGNGVTLPRRTDRVRLSIHPGPNTTISTVRVGKRVVLHDTAGLRGSFTVGVSQFETARLSFDANASLSRGTVTLTYYPVETRKARLEVTVDG